MKTNLGVIGATGKTGTRVIKKLQNLGFKPRALSRKSVPGFDWNRPEAWADSLSGLESVYITYQPDLAVPRAQEDIQRLVAVAKRVGLKHLVILSGRGEEGAQRAEDIIKDSGLQWNVVRAGWFMQNFSESFMREGIISRRLVLPEPKAKEPFIDVDDIADVVVAALTREALRNREFEITGPEILSFADCVTLISSAIGEPIQFQAIAIDDYLNAAKAEGMDEDIAWLMQSLFTEVLDGRNEWMTDTVAQVLGRAPRRFDDYVKSTMQTGAWKALQPSEVES